MSDHISKSSLTFLKALVKNNNREWFEANKPTYREEHDKMIGFAELLLEEMNTHDDIETPTGKKSLHRIYRDIRFSKNKLPYKDNFSGSFKRATKLLRGGYYYHISPGNSFAAGGFWGPNSDDLKRIREDIDYNYEEWYEVLNQASITENFEGLLGHGVKTAPKGYPKDHPAIELLRMKQFYLERSFTDKEVMAPGFAEQLSSTFKAMRPWLDLMSEILTTNSNGEVIV